MSVPLPSDDFLIDLVDKYRLIISSNSDNSDYPVIFNGAFIGKCIPIDRNNISLIKVKYNIIEKISHYRIIGIRNIIEKYMLLLFNHLHSMEINFDKIPLLSSDERAYYNLFINKSGFNTNFYLDSTLLQFIFVLLKVIEYYTNLNSVIDLNEKDNISNDNKSNLISSSSKFINLPKKKKHIRKI